MKLTKNTILLAGLMLFSSCSNFEDINTNEDSATKVNSSLLATGAIMGIMKPSTSEGFINNQLYTKYMIMGAAMNPEAYNQFGRENFDGYTYLKDYKLMEELAPEKDKNSYRALGLFLKSYRLFSYTLNVGDIPYSEILQGKEGVLTPKYDSQKSVLMGILTDLEEAYTLFKSGTTFSGDPILKGDPAKWAKVVTAFQLRALIQLSKKVDDPDLKVKEKFNAIYTRGDLFASNADNWQVTFSDKSGQLYPFHNSINRAYEYPMLSATLIDILKKHEDYRLFYFASPRPQKIIDGVSESSWDAYEGVDVSSPFADVKSVYAAKMNCPLNKRYTHLITGEPYIYLGYSEQNFILAEAALRGWITADASELYMKGIEANMNFIMGSTPDDIAYHHGRKMTNETVQSFLNKASIQLTGTFDQKLKMIMEQKYVAAFMQLPFQPYYDYRRTGFPVFPINPETNLNFKEPTKMPVRWLYPDVEYKYNKAQLQKALDNQYDGIDEVNKLMWILK